MAHKVFNIDTNERKRKKITLPKLEGRFGISFYIGSKEVFIGIQIGNVLIEEITRRRFAKLNKSKVNVFNFEPQQL